MYLKEQFTMYEMAENLVFRYNYEILHLNEQKEEIWLEKVEKNISYIIRLVHQGFDWKNHLKKDISTVFQKTHAMKRLLGGKKIEISNIYFASHSPVDDWEILKKPLLLNDKKQIKMNVYYLDQVNFKEEQTRLHKAIAFDIADDIEAKTDSELEMLINKYKAKLSQTLINKRKESENIFSFGKPLLTYFLLAINIAMFILLEINGGSQNIETLIQFGAKYNAAIMNGDWWRIISSMFLHIGFLHLLMNMLAIYYLGSLVERIFGSLRFLVVYLLAGIGGGIASFAFTSNVSAGASGALFGLFGALIFFGIYYKRIFFQTIGKNILLLIGINIVFGFSVPQIDNGAHLGGLIFGFIAAGIVHLPKKKHLLVQLLAVVIYVSALSGLIFYGVQESTDGTYQLVKIENLLKEGQFEEVIEVATKGLENPNGVEAELLFQRSFAYIELDKVDLAIKDLEQSIEIQNDLPESYYNLALLYNEKGETNNAIAAVKTAYQLKPDDKAYADLYEAITGEKAD